MKALTITRNVIRTGTVVLMAGAVIVATADGFAQSYAGLYQWALDHKLSGWKAESFPLLVDLFILVGELGLFLLAIDGHRIRKSWLSVTDIALPFTVATTGWLVSLWFNVGHVKHATFEDQVTAGVPPITAMIGLLILLRTVHRYMTRLDEDQNAGSSIIPDLDAQRIKPETLPEAPAVLPEAPSAGELEAPENLIPVRPEPVPATVPEPADMNTSERVRMNGDHTRHPKWNEGVKLYRESRNGPGKPLSQRDLAQALGQRNRVLAAAIIKYVKENDSDEVTDNLSATTGTATSP